MKKIFSLVAALTLLAGVSSCQKNIEPSQPQPSGEFRQVSIKAGASQTRTSVSAGALIWSANDKLGIVPQSGSVAAAKLNIKSGVGEVTGTFEGQIDASITDDTLLYGWCGGSWTYSSGSLSVDMPATQTYVSNGLAENAYPSIGTGTIKNGITLSNPMGVLKLTVKGETTDLVKSITVTSAANNLAGSFTVDPSSSYAVSGGSSKTLTLNVASPYVALSSTGINFYVVVPPAEYAAGDLTVTITKSDDTSFSNTFADALTVTANNATPKEVKEELPKYICFEAEENNSTVDLVGVSFGRPLDFEYSIDGGDSWNDLTEAVSRNNGEKCFIRTKVARKKIIAIFSGMELGACKFSCSGNFKVSGNIMALLNSTAPTTIMDSDNAGCFAQLFSNCTAITDASELYLSATTLAPNCYSSMFSGCTALENAPSIPATTLASDCCVNMFNGCTSLTAAPPVLPAVNLADKCYYYMFDKCSSLVTPPAMSATTLGSSSCEGMFSECTSLTSAPDMSAVTTVAYHSCDAMFKNCTSLNAAPVLNATTLGDGCYNQMFCGCTSLTAAPALPATTLVDNCYNSMFDNCTNLVTAPVLGAQTLVPYCYNAIFAYCSKLSSVTMLATGGFDTECCLNSWLNSNTGTDSSVTSRTVYVASGMVDAVKATVPGPTGPATSPDWQSGVQVIP